MQHYYRLAYKMTGGFLLVLTASFEVLTGCVTYSYILPLVLPLQDEACLLFGRQELEARSLDKRESSTEWC